MGKNKQQEQLELLDQLAGQGLIEDVLGVVKSGKEATVYCCTLRATGALVAAKVYRGADVRRFANDASYLEGRLRRKTRFSRAIETKTRKGREFAFGAWVHDEYETLGVLHRAGADVPEPVALQDNVIVMEYIGDEGEPAPPLGALRLDEPEARDAFSAILRNIELALACDRVHGDLSPFNVLYWDGRVRLIDFPQAVDARFNSNARTLLERDVGNICAYFSRDGVEADAARISRDLWSRYIRAEL